MRLKGCLASIIVTGIESCELDCDQYRADISHEFLGWGGEKPKFSDDEPSRATATTTVVGTHVKSYGLFDRCNFSVTKISPYLAFQP